MIVESIGGRPPGRSTLNAAEYIKELGEQTPLRMLVARIFRERGRERIAFGLQGRGGLRFTNRP